MKLKTVQAVLKTLEDAGEKEAWDILEMMARTARAALEEEEEKKISEKEECIICAKEIVEENNTYWFICGNERCNNKTIFETRTKLEDIHEGCFSNLPKYCSGCGRKIIWELN